MITRDRYMQLSILGSEEGSRLSQAPCEGVIGYKQLNHDDDAEHTGLTLILPH